VAGIKAEAVNTTNVSAPVAAAAPVVIAPKEKGVLKKVWDWLGSWFD
jgi:hypothetical protein